MLIRKHILLLSVLLFLITNSAFGQEKVITGTVSSLENGEPVAFVTIVVKGTNNGASTDLDGKYSIQQLSAADTLIFSFVGYATQKILVGEQKVIDIKLKATSQQLDEVVVTALAVNRQKRELGYSTDKVDGAEIQQSNSPNVLNALTGKVSGVQITNPDGVDGGTTRITIRGNNSIDGNNQPLIVVDGIPISNDPGLTDIGRGRDWGSAINNINME
ncbi:MAG: carboxypeptidase-like regulatory domain-containing protein, partial [Chitinophagales bacterium]